MRYQPTIVLNQLKTLSYGGNMRATRLAQRDGADEALLVEPDGTVLEAPTSTLFWVDTAGQPAHPGARHRRARIDHARADHATGAGDRGRDCSLSDVLGASELFLASSLREVQGVSVLDGLEFGCPGPVTLKVADLLAEHIQAEITGAISLEGG